MARSSEPLSPWQQPGPPQVALPAESIEYVNGITFFLVEVVPSGGSLPWAVPRRYSDFDKLRRILGFRGERLLTTPFPPKFLCTCENHRLEERRIGLERWLQELLRSPFSLQVPVAWHVKRFLVDTSEVRAADVQAALSLFPPHASNADAEELQNPQTADSSTHLEVPRDAQTPPRFGKLPERLRNKLQHWRGRQCGSSEHCYSTPVVPGGPLHTPSSSSATWDVESNSNSVHANDLLRHSFAGFLPSPEVERAQVAGESFEQCARLIARDLPRTFSGNPKVDHVRLHVADVLRSYARKDPELGYTQGMCFPAAAVCLSHEGSAADRCFEAIMKNLRGLWLPGFPLAMHGIALFRTLLQESDPEVLAHFSSIGADFTMILTKPWLTLFARWLPLGHFVDLLPFLEEEGLIGMLAITLVMLLHHRWFLLGCEDLEETLLYLSSLPLKSPPERFMDMCTDAVPTLRSRTALLAPVAGC